MDNERKLAIVRRKYGDILEEPRPLSAFPRASMEQRAALFMPFDALTGYDDAIVEVQRQTEEEINFGDDDYRIYELDRTLEQLRSNLKAEPKVKVAFFLQDEKKSGGRYCDYSGNLRRIDEVQRMLIFSDGTKIAFKSVCKIVLED